MMVDGFETIVGEARYAFDADTASFEFGLSIDDRWQGQGIGKALLKNLECRAAAFGAERLFGDTLRSNDAMIALARKSGYAFTPSPGDWKLVRFEKQIDVAPQEIPCASWRLAAVSRQAQVLACELDKTEPGSGHPEPGYFLHAYAASSAKSVEVATSPPRQPVPVQRRRSCASIRSTVSLPSGSRSGGFLALTSCEEGFASLRGSPRWP